MQFLERDAFRLIEASSKLVDKVVDTCGVKEENKFSIELIRTVQHNYMEPLLNNTWPGWKVRVGMGIFYLFTVIGQSDARMCLRFAIEIEICGNLFNNKDFSNRFCKSLQSICEI
jgi:hypothetical protein